MGRTREYVGVSDRKPYPCPRCSAPINRGDVIRRTKIDGTHYYIHNDCRGRLEVHLGLNPAAHRPAPPDFNSRPHCPECGAVMAKSVSEAIWLCVLSERHASRQRVTVPR